jgi:hypothetical protein
MKKEVKNYINKQKSPQKEILEKVRKIILKTLPDCNEEMKWGAAAFAGGKFYIVGLKDSVNVGFSINGLSKEEASLFTGSGKTMRSIKIQEFKDIDEKKLIKLIRLVDKKAICKKC